MMRMGYREAAGEDQETTVAECVRLLGDAGSNAWLEDETRVDGMQLRQDVSAADAKALVRDWPRGRLFNQAAEIRWQRSPDGALHLVLLTEAYLPPETEGEIALDPVDEPYHLILWGSVGPDGWQEDRVPGVANGMCYPDSWQGPYAAIKARDYEEREPRDVERTVIRYLELDGNFTPAPLGDVDDATTT